jgi:NADH-quinone oxidoreductase subunit L
LVTSLYAFRMVFLTFWGTLKTRPVYDAGFRMGIPLCILACLSIVGGYIELPHTLGHFPWLSDFLSHTFPAKEKPLPSISLQVVLQGCTALLAILGILAAYGLYGRSVQVAVSSNPILAALRRLWAAGWGFDAFYDRFFVRPFVRLAAMNRHDVLDAMAMGMAGVAALCNAVLVRTETGNVRWYAMWIVMGTVIALTVGAFL